MSPSLKVGTFEKYYFGWERALVEEGSTREISIIKGDKVAAEFSIFEISNVIESSFMEHRRAVGVGAKFCSHKTHVGLEVVAGKPGTFWPNGIIEIDERVIDGLF